MRRAVIGGSRGDDIDRLLENVVYRELVRRGWRVTVGRVREREVDFVCQNGDEQRGQTPAEGVGRSAAESFLFRYLEAMPATKGLFALNGRLPIPFGPNGFMEVDLLCASRRVAVEVDGKFHFDAPENYRRDRRKDFLLQKAGFLVLRLLAEDVVARLSDVLDAIDAALACRSRQHPEPSQP